MIYIIPVDMITYYGIFLIKFSFYVVNKAGFIRFLLEIFLFRLIRGILSKLSDMRTDGLIRHHILYKQVKFTGIFDL